MSSLVNLLFSSLLIPTLISAQSISTINGNRFISPLRNQAVANVTGLVTATGPDGFWLRSNVPDRDERTSESIYVFRSGGLNATAGDIIAVSGRVSEYRSSSAHLFLTEITSPVISTVFSSGNPGTPLTIGTDTPYPPTKQFTSLDNGDVFGLPNNVSLVSVANPVLSPRQYGLDFWESLTGELVTVRAPIAIAKPNNFRDTWVRGSASPTTNLNSRGGLTMTDADANPESIIIGTPLDGSANPNTTKLGDDLADITGIVTYAFGFYRILPLTAISVTNPQTPPPSPASLISSDTCDSVVIGSYNVENLSPAASNLPLIATHIVDYLHSPPLLFLQEIQDDNGVTNDAVVSANLTLTTLATAIAAQGGPAYEFIDIVPVDDQDGGAPGGNIRVAYMYNPEVVELVNPNPGSSTDAIAVTTTGNGPSLNFNPGRIEPGNEAWEASRKPLVAQWRFVDSTASTSSIDNETETSTASASSDRRAGRPGPGGNPRPGPGGNPWFPTPSPPSQPGRSGTFFTINLHFASKGGSSSLHGDPRPPVNGGVDQRLNQTRLVADFIQDLLAVDPRAKIVAGGDWNEFSFVQPLEELVADGDMVEADVVAGLPVNERYTYLFDMNSQQLDHVFVSQAVASARVGGANAAPGGGWGWGRPGNGNDGGNGAGRLQVEHVHVNTWVERGAEASDHDPTVVKLNLC